MYALCIAGHITRHARDVVLYYIVVRDGRVGGV